MAARKLTRYKELFDLDNYKEQLRKEGLPTLTYAEFEEMHNDPSKRTWEYVATIKMVDEMADEFMSIRRQKSR